VVHPVADAVTSQEFPQTVNTIVSADIVGSVTPHVVPVPVAFAASSTILELSAPDISTIASEILPVAHVLPPTSYVAVIVNVPEAVVMGAV
jgi:hypothetical protein